MGAPAAIIGGATAGVGSLLSGFSGSAQAKAQARQAQMQAQVAARNADIALDAGLTNAQRDYQQGNATLGAQRAQMAANGVALDSGSALDVQEATGRTTGQNVGNTLYQADSQAVDQRNQATSYNNQARAYRAQSSSSLFGGFMGAASAGLSTAVDLGAFGSPDGAGKTASATAKSGPNTASYVSNSSRFNPVSWPVYTPNNYLPYLRGY